MENLEEFDKNGKIQRFKTFEDDEEFKI